jgi:hypothetical protein
MRLFTILVAATVLSLSAVPADAQQRDGFRIALRAQGAADVHYAVIYSPRDQATGLATGRRLAGGAAGLQAWSFRIDEKWQIAFKAEVTGLTVRPNRALRKLAVSREGYRFLVDQPGLFIAVTDEGCEINLTEAGIGRISDEDLGIAIDEPGLHVTIASRGAHFGISEPGVQ